MSAPLLGWAPPSVSRLVVAWLVPLLGAGKVGMQRPQNGGLPYCLVNVVAGKEDERKLMQSSTVSVHTFADNMDDAESTAQTVHQRMLLLGPPLAPPQQVTLTLAGGATQTVVPHSVTTNHIPTWLDYQDDQIYRFAARYDIDVRFAAA